eukprot:CAMPEP_0197592856 /NCGR_PEP_ID=MMETSP1326-20131121/16142_1 /TAXON_ID=1155430 /ORGANISM="Genus nov. species nov., Strain RCC2288" /LENGTH=360 /DNA_ID=CAMNT_0043158661 /DNA_START=48 /DNA_END=1130 /DNA_ORIENTATION=+
MATVTCNAFSAMTASLDSFEANTVERHACGDDDVVFDIKFCGICHTDVHFVKNDLGMSAYPLTPGHELAGVVTAVGKNVSKLAVGDKVGVGCMVDACHACKNCNKFEEQYCATGSTFTYGGMSTYGRAGPNGKPTVGGYSDVMVVHERYAIKVPADAPLDQVAPLLCAGITMYDPLVRFGCSLGGKKVGIAGIGGLGMMGIKIAAAMGCEVTAISTSANKEAMSMSMGAAKFLLTSDAAAMAAAAGSLDIVLDTVSANHELMPYANLLCGDGQMTLIGLTTEPFSVPGAPFLFSQKSLRGSLIGGTQRTQEMIDFCCSKGVYPDIKVIPATEVMDVLKKLEEKNDSIVRYVIDCATIPKK